uniref:BPI2 domain-containing protein n=1 Tax=Caenorhabditis tropicalis TaxID=1561998 RepID=A0A1I7U3A2_9PELO
MNPLLFNDRTLKGPGVIARVTPTGTQYVASVVAAAFSSHFADIKPPKERKDHQLSTVSTVTLRRLMLETLQLDKQLVSTTTSDGLLRIAIRNISVSSSAVLSGELRGIKLQDNVTFRTPSLRLDVAIRISKNTGGNPALKMESCKILTQGIKLVTKPMDPRNGKSIADGIAIDANSIFSDMICSKIDHIVTNRVNQRFALLSSRISLEDSKNFDIVKIIMQAEERMKRLVRQNMIRSNKTMRRNVHAHTARRISRDPIRVRGIRQTDEDKFHLILNSFNFSRADSLMLDYSMLSSPSLTSRGIELQTSGEVFQSGHVTPFGAGPIFLPRVPNPSQMLQIVVSDFVPNSLMFHGHRIKLFDTRIDWTTPQFGPVMRTTCDLSTGSLFCIGDLFPALREMLPDRNIAFVFTTLKAPAVIVQTEEKGGIHFSLLGLIRLISDRNEPIGEMEIRIEALMKMKLTPKSVKGKVTIEEIQFTSRSPRILLQEELDDAGFLSREILQRMVNDILRQGIPIPIHPLFKLVKPKLTLLPRSMLLETNFILNEHIIAQLTAENLIA